MKNILLLVIMLLIMIKGVAQNQCSKFYPLKEGTKFQITTYDQKDKASAVIDYLVQSATGDAATLAFEMHDEKGKLIVESEYDIICEDDGVAIDFRSLISPGVFEQYKDMEVDITGTNVLLPNSLSEGMTLPDAEMLMTVNMTPITMKLNSKIFNRKVVGKENVTTPAGSFDCFLITYDHDSKMVIKLTGSAKQWLAEGIGLVKQIDYNKSGKVISSSQLTKFEQ